MRLIICGCYISKSWALVDTELWVMYMVGGQHSSLVSGGNNGNNCFKGFALKSNVFMNIIVLNGQSHCMINCPKSLHSSSRSHFSTRQTARPGAQQGIRPQVHNFARPPRFAATRFMGPRSHSN